MDSPLILLDGAMGTLLESRGRVLPAPRWSAAALEEAPLEVGGIHREYAEAGASVHCTCTFRTTRRVLGEGWELLAGRAVRLARDAAGATGRVAGSLAPLEDCWRPDLSPPDPEPEHALLAQVLADAGVDLLLCETFPHVEEALAAVRAAVATGLPTWLSLTAGPRGDLLTPDEMRLGARAAVDCGAEAVLVNCVPAEDTARFLEAVADTGVPFGAYANAGGPDSTLGLGVAAGEDGATRYAELAAGWVQAGASMVGGCCGTGPAHIRALAALLASP